MKVKEKKSDGKQRKAVPYGNRSGQCATINQRSLAMQRKDPQKAGGESRPLRKKKKSVAANGVRRRRFFPPSFPTQFVTHSQQLITSTPSILVLFLLEEL